MGHAKLVNDLAVLVMGVGAGVFAFVLSRRVRIIVSETFKHPRMKSTIIFEEGHPSVTRSK